MTKKDVTDILSKIIEWSLYILIFCLPFSKSIIEITITVALIAWVTKKILLILSDVSEEMKIVIARSVTTKQSQKVGLLQRLRRFAMTAKIVVFTKTFLVLKKFRLKKTPLNISLFALFFASLISLINADDKFFVSYALITKCLKWIILYFIIVEEINNETKLKNLLKMALLSGVIIAIDVIIQFFWCHEDLLRGYPSFKFTKPDSRDGFYRGFPTGPFPFPNDLSAWLMMIMIPAIVIGLFGLSFGLLRAGFGIMSLVFLYIFYLANTRSAWFGFGLSVFIILLIKKIRLLIVVLMLVLLAYPFLPKNKITDVFSMVSVYDRGVMWSNGWNIFMQHPIIGNGLNTFFGKYMEIREDEFKGKRGSYAHNGYLQIAADIGIVGISIYLFIIGQVFYYSYRFIRRCKDKFYQSLALGIAGGLLAFLIHSFFDTNLHSLPLIALFWFTVGVLFSLDSIGCKNGEQ